MRKILLVICLFVVGQIWAQQNLKDQYNLMPWPQEVSQGEGHFVIQPNFEIIVNQKGQSSSRIVENTSLFIRNLSNKSGVFFKKGFPEIKQEQAAYGLTITFETSPELKLGIDESYQLNVSQNAINIVAKTDVGAVHGLQTLLQLLTVEDGRFVFPSVEIIDHPRFEWRGLMLDVARHFMPVEVVKRNLDLMSYVKLNVMHWHLSDDQGFRFESKTFPLLIEKGSDGLYYTQEQIKDIIAYADARGIRVMPEIDVPGHASAILTAYPDIGSKDMTYQIERNAGIFNPTLDPTNEKTYEFLNALFKEVAEVFPDEYFHIGGDENAGKHWDENKDIQAFKKKHKLKTNHDLQTYMNIRLEKTLRGYGKKVMGWDEIMTPNMPKTAIIHSWRGVNEGMPAGGTMIQAAKSGYKTVLSNGFYIDLLQSVKDHYLVKFDVDESLTDSDKQNILGAEATMWSELVTPLTIDSRIWPRTAAIAERFWSDKTVRDVPNMYKRLDELSFQLENIGSVHLRNRDVILRNVNNNQSIDALIKLVNISEPYKIYTRNAGGTQYQSYSPFSHFVDACTSDARDAMHFDYLQNQYVKNGSATAKAEILVLLNQWQALDKTLQEQAKKAPMLPKLLPYSGRIAKVSSILIKGLENNRLSKSEFDEIVALLNKKDDDTLNVDVEFAAKDAVLNLAKELTNQSIKK